MRGHLTNVTSEGAVIYFLGEFPAIGINSTAQLKFLRRDTRESLVLDAVATDYLQIDATKKTCQFRFLSTESLQRIQGQDFFSYFNRRKYYRVTHSQNERVPVSLRLGSKAAEGLIIDISVRGMGLGVTQEVGQEIGRHKQLVLMFQPPGTKEELRISGDVRYQKELRPSTRVGVEFNLDLINPFCREEKALASYVTRHQQKALRKRAHIKYGQE